MDEHDAMDWSFPVNLPDLQIPDVPAPTHEAHVQSASAHEEWDSSPTYPFLPIFERYPRSGYPFPETAQHAAEYISPPAEQSNDGESSYPFPLEQVAVQLIPSPAEQSNDGESPYPFPLEQHAAEYISPPAEQSNDGESSYPFPLEQIAVQFIPSPAEQFNDRESPRPSRDEQHAAKFIPTPTGQFGGGESSKPRRVDVTGMSSIPPRAGYERPPSMESKRKEMQAPGAGGVKKKRPRGRPRLKSDDEEVDRRRFRGREIQAAYINRRNSTLQGLQMELQTQEERARRLENMIGGLSDAFEQCYSLAAERGLRDGDTRFVGLLQAAGESFLRALRELEDNKVARHIIHQEVEIRRPRPLRPAATPGGGEDGNIVP